MKKRKHHGFFLFNVVTLLSTVLAMTRMPELSDLTSATPVTSSVIEQPNVDFITIKTLIRQVNSLDTEPVVYLNRIDSMSATIQPERVRNPFTTANVSPPPKATPKKVSKPIVRSKPKPRIKRPAVLINGIVWDTQEPYAILNGELYRVGDEINGYTVYAILDTTVVFKNSRDRYVVNYHEE